MNARRLAGCSLVATVAFCAACKRASPPTPTQIAPAASAAQSRTATGTAVPGVIVSAQPGGTVAGQAGVSGNQPQQKAGQSAANPPAPEAPARPLTDIEERRGPFTLAPGQDFFVIVHSKRMEEQPGKFNEAAAWLEVRDATSAVHYHEDYAYTVEGGLFNEQCSVGAQMLAGSNGKGILISSDCEPSAPLGGGTYRFFGLVHGKLIPFGKNLVVEGNMERFVAGAITKQGAATMILPDMLEFKVFTGNFFVIVPLRVNWIEGRLEPGMRCYEQSGHGAVESVCEVPVVEIQRVPNEQEMTFVRLFPEANERMIPAHVVVRKDSKVEILAAKVQALLNEDKDSMSLAVADDVWVKVRVDDKEGWIHSQEDFGAIGLPQSG